MAVFEQCDVANMQQIEAAVGEDDGLAGGTPLGYAELDAFQVEDFFAGGDSGAGGECGDEFMTGDRDGSDLADHDSCPEICEFDGGFDLQSTCEACGQGSDDRVSCARDVEDLAGACGRMVYASVSGGGRAENADSLLAHRDGQKFEVVFSDQCLSCREQVFRVVDGDAGCGREFAKIGADRCCARVLAEVERLGIGQDGNASRTCGADDGFA